MVVSIGKANVYVRNPDNGSYVPTGVNDYSTSKEYKDYKTGLYIAVTIRALVPKDMEISPLESLDDAADDAVEYVLVSIGETPEE